MKDNNYFATNFRIDQLNGNDSPSIHFVNLEVSGENNYWKNEDNIFNTSKKTIERAILSDSYLKEKNTGKFVIAFPFGFVIYCFGTPGEKGEINSICVRHKEYNFEEEFKSFKEIEQVLPCPLEDAIKVNETSLWHSTKSIAEYYQCTRQTFKIKNKYPEKIE